MYVSSWRAYPTVGDPSSFHFTRADNLTRQCGDRRNAASKDRLEPSVEQTERARKGGDLPIPVDEQHAPDRTVSSGTGMDEAAKADEVLLQEVLAKVRRAWGHPPARKIPESRNHTLNRRGEENIDFGLLRFNQETIYEFVEDLKNRIF